MQSTARYLARATKESGCWLNVLPVTALGTFLDNFSSRSAAAIRTGTGIWQPRTCVWVWKPDWLF